MHKCTIYALATCPWTGRTCRPYPPCACASSAFGFGVCCCGRDASYKVRMHKTVRVSCAAPAYNVQQHVHTDRVNIADTRARTHNERININVFGRFGQRWARVFDAARTAQHARNLCAILGEYFIKCVTFVCACACVCVCVRAHTCDANKIK